MGLYSHYDGAHNHPVNRALHMLAISVGFSSIIVVWWHWIIALLLVPTAFALAWLGHLVEGNKPAFLSNPVHVLVAPVWMVIKILGVENKTPPTEEAWKPGNSETLNSAVGLVTPSPTNRSVRALRRRKLPVF